MITVGRVVLYHISHSDADEINRHRNSNTAHTDMWPSGAQAHVGNTVYNGDTFPMIVCRVWGDSGLINGQVFLDGNDTYWATSRHEGTNPGDWEWPQRVE